MERMVRLSDISLKSDDQCDSDDGGDDETTSHVSENVSAIKMSSMQILQKV
jgi:hypothetical protein